MVLISVCCPHCGRHDNVVKRGKTDKDKQRYLCQHADCPAQTFLLDYDYQGCVPEVKRKILDMAVNGSGIRDTARVLNVSPSTVINELKKGNPPWNRSTARCWNP
jgi:transposase-like protein